MGKWAFILLQMDQKSGCNKNITSAFNRLAPLGCRRTNSLQTLQPEETTSYRSAFLTQSFTLGGGFAIR